MGIIKNALYSISNKGMFSLYKNQSIFPYYHLVSDTKVAHIDNLYIYKNVLQFKNDLDILLKYFTPVNPENLLHNKFQKNTFLISFDDGLEEIYSVIYPILKEKKITAIFFINPTYVDNNIGLYQHYISTIINYLKESDLPKDLIDKVNSVLCFDYNTDEEFLNKFRKLPYKDRNKINDIINVLNFDMNFYLKDKKPYISKDQIQEMIDDGFYFGGHTMTHPPLNELNFHEQKAEIVDSINWLKNNFGLSYSLFAFPFTDKNISRKLINELFEFDENLLLFGNSGFKKDIDDRIIQRISFENPKKNIKKLIVSEHLYKYFNFITGKYYIKRK